MEHLEHLTATREALTQLMAAHARVVLWASGGKDSLTLLHLLQPWRERLTVLHNAVDGGFPGVTENLQACVEQWGFAPMAVVQPTLTLDDYVARHGWPVEIVPTALDGVLPTPYFEGPYKVSSWWYCTIVRQIQPLVAGSRALQADAILTGARASDAPLFRSMPPMTDLHELCGAVRYDPLREWTTAQIWAYVDAQGIPLPPTYAWKRGLTWDAPDCRLCTWRPEYRAWLREHEPETFAELWSKAGPTLQAVEQALQAHLGLLGQAEAQAVEPESPA